MLLNFSGLNLNLGCFLFYSIFILFGGKKASLPLVSWLRPSILSFFKINKSAKKRLIEEHSQFGEQGKRGFNEKKKAEERLLRFIEKEFWTDEDMKMMKVNAMVDQSAVIK